jgi:hypothetical protein
MTRLVRGKGRGGAVLAPAGGLDGARIDRSPSIYTSAGRQWFPPESERRFDAIGSDTGSLGRIVAVKATACPAGCRLAVLHIACAKGACPGDLLHEDRLREVCGAQR